MLDFRSMIITRRKLTEKDAARVKVLNTQMAVSEAGTVTDPYKFTARITTDAVDREGEVVVPAGGDLTEFMACGMLFSNHDYTKPIGFPNKLKTVVRGDRFIELGMMFMRDDAEADKARNLVTQAMGAGINAGVSIGFLPIESRKATRGDIAKYGEGVQVVHSKWKLLELSIAPVQANQEAVIVAIGKGLARPVVKRAVHCVYRLEPTVDASSVAEKMVRVARAKAFGRVYAD